MNSPTHLFSRAAPGAAKLRHYFLAFLLAQASLAALLFYDWQATTGVYYAQAVAHLEVEYRTAFTTYRRLGRLLFQTALDQPAVREILRQANQADPATRQSLREDLHRRLSELYRHLQEHTASLLQFHLADGDSFLRFHDPAKFGDGLQSLRPGIRQVVTEHAYAEGFEVGRYLQAFRYIYPLSADDGEYLGSVEIGFPFRGFEEILSGALPVDYFLAIRKSALPERAETSDYVPAAFGTDFVYRADDHLEPVPHIPRAARLSAAARAALERRIAPRLEALLAQGRAFALSARWNGTEYLLAFLPLQDIAGRKIGYIFSCHPDTTLASMQYSHFLSHGVATLLLLAVLFVHKRAHDRLRARLDFQQDLLDSVPLPIFLKDQRGAYLGCNRTCARLLCTEDGGAEKPGAGQAACDAACQGKCGRIEERWEKTGTVATSPEGGTRYEATLTAADDTQQTWLVHETRFLDRAFQREGSISVALDISERKRAEQEIRQLNTYLHSVLDSAGEGIFGLDRSGRVSFINRTGADMLGWRPEDMLGKVQHYLIHHSRADGSPYPLAECPTEKSMAHGVRYVESREVYWRKDGTPFPVEYTTTPIYDARGTITGAVVVFRDIGERQRAEARLKESEDKLRTVTAAANDAILMMDEHGLITFWNAAAERIFGHSEAVALGQNLHRLVAPARYWPAFRSSFARFVETGEGPFVGKTYEIEGVRGDGTEIPLEVSLAAVRIAGRWHSVGIVRDMTARKQEALALARAKEQAETANRAKSEFLANVSHEIRTPLNAILGFAQILQKDANLHANQREQLRVIQGSGEQLLTLLNDILDLARIEAQKMDLNTRIFPLPRFLSEIVNMHRGCAEREGLAFHYRETTPLPRNVQGDPARLRQVLFNLLGNAVKFTEHGEVVFQVAYRDAKLYVEIRDTGPGIGAERLQTLFLPFQQTGEQRYAHPSTGLGLALSKKFIEMMGGSLEVTSTPGKGSIFCFDLALPEADGAAPAGAPDTPASAQAGAARVPAAPAPEVVRRLYDTARRGDVFELIEQIRALAETQPALAPFTAQLAHLAENFRLGQVCALLRPYLDEQ